jgi:hypothetical protein
VLEAAAFSPIRTHVTPSGPPSTVADELRTTVTRLSPALPQVAAMFGIEPAPNASMPKPLRPTARAKPTKPRKAAAPSAKAAKAEQPAVEPVVDLTPPPAAAPEHTQTPSSPPSAPEAEHGDQADPAAAPEHTPTPSSPPSAPEAEHGDQADPGADPTPEPAATREPGEGDDTISSDPAVGDIPPV